MKHINHLRRHTAAAYARRVAAICKSGNVHTRHLDDCFEMNISGDEVVREFLRLHDRDADLRAACATDAVRERVNVDEWRAKYGQKAQPTTADSS